MKKCLKCKELKPANTVFFHKNNGVSSGLHSYCKECFKKRHQQNYVKKEPREFYPLVEISCNKCGCEYIAKPEFFTRRKKSRSGLAGICKKCEQQRQRDYMTGKDASIYNKRMVNKYIDANENSDPYANEALKLCNDCNKEKELICFSRNRTRPDGLKSICKDCSKIRRENYKRRFPEKDKLQQKKAATQWRKENPDKVTNSFHRRRAREKNLPNALTVDEWEYALSYFNGCCAVCERQLNDLFGTHYASQDHWIPISYDGKDNPGHVVGNVVPLCHGLGGCNNHKSAKMPDVWLTETYGKRKANEILARIQAYFDHVQEQQKSA